MIFNLFVIFAVLFILFLYKIDSFNNNIMKAKKFLKL